MIVGNRRVREGEIFINGIPVQNMAVKDRKAMGLGYIPSDRHKNAMIPSFSITENFLLGYQETPEYCRKGFIDYERLRQDAEKQVEEFEIKVAGVDQERITNNLFVDLLRISVRGFRLLDRSLFRYGKMVGLAIYGTAKKENIVIKPNIEY